MEKPMIQINNPDDFGCLMDIVYMAGLEMVQKHPDWVWSDLAMYDPDADDAKDDIKLKAKW